LKLVQGFGEMGLIKKVEEAEKGIVKIEFIPTIPFCPLRLNLL